MWKLSPTKYLVSYNYRYLKHTDSEVRKRPFNLYASMSLFGMLYPMCFEYAEMVRFYHSVYRIVYHPHVCYGALAVLLDRPRKDRMHVEPTTNKRRACAGRYRFLACWGALSRYRPICTASSISIGAHQTFFRGGGCLPPHQSFYLFLFLGTLIGG